MESLAHVRLVVRRRNIEGSQALRILQLTDIHQFPLDTNSWAVPGKGLCRGWGREVSIGFVIPGTPVCASPP